VRLRFILYEYSAPSIPVGVVVGVVEPVPIAPLVASFKPAPTLEAVAIGQLVEIPKKRRKYGTDGLKLLADGRWQASLYDTEGRRRRKSFNDEEKAAKWLTKMVVLKDAGKLDPKEGRVKVTQLAESYKLDRKNTKPKSYAWIELVWKVHLEPFFGDFVATRIGTDRFNVYIAHRQEGLSGEKLLSRNTTINKELGILKAMYRHGAGCEPPLVNRVPRFPKKLKEPAPRTAFVNDEQYAEILKGCKQPWLRAFVTIASGHD